MPIVIQPGKVTGKLFSSGKERMHAIMGERQALTTPVTLTKGGQSVTEAVMMSKDCGIMGKTRSNEVQEMKDGGEVSQIMFS